MNSFPINPSNHLSSIPATIIEQMGTQKFSLQSDGNVVADHNSTVHSQHQPGMFSRNPGFLIASIILLLLVGGSFFALFRGMQTSSLPGVVTRSQVPLSLTTSIKQPTQNSGTGIYVAMDTYLYKLDRNGKTKLWEHNIKGLGSTIAVSGGIVYADSSSSQVGGVVYAFRATDGKLLWQTRVTSPKNILGKLTVDDQTIYVASDEINIYALNANNGKQRWMYPTHYDYANRGYAPGPIVAVKDAVYINIGSMFYTLSPTNGHLLWQRSDPTGGFLATPLALNGVVYITTWSEAMPIIAQINAYTTGGKLLWSSTVKPSASSSNFLTLTMGRGLLYASNANSVYAFDTTNGKIVWHHSVGVISDQMQVYAHDTLYLVLQGPYQGTPAQSSDKPNISSIIALDGRNGSLIWEKKNMNRPTIQTVVNGVLYVELQDDKGNGHVYALSTANHAVLWSYTHPIPNPLHPQGSGNTLVVIP